MLNQGGHVEVESLCREYNVSRGTLGLLERYVSLIESWNVSINLISKKDMKYIWQRHIGDSLRLFPWIPRNSPGVADLGSGAGLPGIVLACAFPDIPFFLVERDARKCAFLRNCCAVLGLGNRVQVVNRAIEQCYDLPCSVLTARALASLNELCHLTYPFFQKKMLAIFLKGDKIEKECEEALQEWDIDYSIHSSIFLPGGISPLPVKPSEPGGNIISIQRLEPKQHNREVI